MDKGAQAAARPVKGSSFASLQSGLAAFAAAARAVAPSGARLPTLLTPGIFPWADTVLDEEAQQRVAPSLLGRDEGDVRLVSMFPEERSAAAAHAPNVMKARDLSRALDDEASPQGPADSTAGSGGKTPPTPRRRISSPRRSPASLAGSGLASPRREAVEAALQQKDQTHATAIQAAAQAAFPGASRALLNAGRIGSSTGLPLGLLGPVVMTQIASAIHGQHILAT